MINLRYALRTLFRKTPFVTAVAILSLALGIGANAAIFSMFNEVMLRSLPVQDPERLVNLSTTSPRPGQNSCGQAGDCDTVFSYPMFLDLERVQTSFTGVAAHCLFGANLSYLGQTLSSQGLEVSGSYFQVLGLQPALGRLIGPDDTHVVGESHVVVLSHGYWTSRFASDPNVLNQPMIVNGQTLTIIGVAPRGFDGTTLGARPQVFVPMTLREFMQPGFKGFDNRRSYWAYLFARLKPGTSIESARAAVGAQYHAIINDVEAPLQKGMSDQTMARFRAKPILLEPGPRGQSSVDREAGTPLKLLFGVTAFVLLIACANIANLLLAKSSARSPEMAVRLSLGASRRQLVAQLLTESVLLAICGGLAGILVAGWTLSLIAAMLPAEVTETLAFRIDGSVMLFAGALAIGTGVVFGLFPALHSTRPDLVSTLKGQAGQPSGARGAKWFRLVLATAQITMSMALLAAAGLFTKSLLNVSRVDLGLKIENIVTFGISPELNAYTADRSRVLFQRLEEELAATPGVTAVTTSMVPLLAGSNWGNGVAVQGFEQGPDTDNGSRFNDVGPGYFRALGIPLMSGREFTPGDTITAPKVAVVNEEFVRKFGLGRDAVGKMMGTDGGAKAKLDRLIVGVVQNAKYSDVKDKIPPLYFLPYRQDPEVGSMSFYVRTSSDPKQVLGALPGIVKRLDPNLPLENVRTLVQQVKDNTFLDRMMSTLSAAFAVLATLLAAIGLYGVLAYTVAQRTREIGLRMALGAAPGRVRRMVMAQVAWMTLIGAVIGLACAFGVGRAAESVLYELKGNDTWVFAIAALVLTAIALAAGFLPAHRASRVDPMRALRYE
jgi:putative ABC transport system permease protein